MLHVTSTDKEVQSIYLLVTFTFKIVVMVLPKR